MLISTIRPNIRKESVGLFISTPKHIPQSARASCSFPVHVREVSFSILTISRKVDQSLWNIISVIIFHSIDIQLLLFCFSNFCYLNL